MIGVAGLSGWRRALSGVVGVTLLVGFYFYRDRRLDHLAWNESHRQMLERDAGGVEIEILEVARTGRNRATVTGSFRGSCHRLEVIEFQVTSYAVWTMVDGVLTRLTGDPWVLDYLACPESDRRLVTQTGD